MGIVINPTGKIRMAYSAFNRLRQAVAESVGGSFPPHYDGEKYDDDAMWYTGDWKLTERPGLTLFFSSNDCEGHFSPEQCKQIADELSRWVLPAMKERAAFFDQIGTGHIARAGGYRVLVEQLIESFHEGYNKGTGVTYG